MPTQAEREYYAQRQVKVKYETVEFSNPSFNSVYLVANQLSNKTFLVNGNQVEFTAVSAEIPDQPEETEGTATATIRFGRVGTEFLEVLESSDPFGSMSPIDVIVRIYLGGEDDPISSYSLVVSEEGVNIGEDTVEVPITTTNPLRLTTNLFYNPDVFTGLQNA